METSTNSIISETSRPQHDNIVHNDSELFRWTPWESAVTFKPAQAFYSGRNLLKLWPRHRLSMTTTGRV